MCDSLVSGKGEKTVFRVRWWYILLKAKHKHKQKWIEAEYSFSVNFDFWTLHCSGVIGNVWITWVGNNSTQPPQESISTNSVIIITTMISSCAEIQCLKWQDKTCTALKFPFRIRLSTLWIKLWGFELFVTAFKANVGHL